MQRQGAAVFAGFLIVAWAVLSVVLLVKGGLYIAKHEGDTMHLIDIVLRQAGGEWPHLDFMTPIGLLATAPIAALVGLGWGVGMAMLGAQVLVAGLFLLPIWWVGASRLQTGWALVFGAICLGLSLALVHGEPQPSLSVSMHYNRWAWALAFMAIATAILPPVNRQSSVADGLVMGLSVAALALIKVTYVAAFLPAIVVALLLRRDWTALGVAIAAGLGVVAVVTLAAGPAFWGAYLSDLLTVTGSDTRPHPGHELNGVIAAPAYLGGSFAALASVVLLRQAKRQDAGLVLLLLVPGFFYVTYQNFGNDPQWLYLLGVLLFALRPEPGIRNGFGWDMRQALALAGCAVFMLGLPSALNLGFSPFRHFFANAGLYQPMFPRSEQQDDIFVLTSRNAQPTGTVKRPVIGLDLPEPEETVPPAILLGETLPECELSGGTITIYDGMARDIEQAGFAGAALYGADLLTSYWLFGDFRRLPGGAPWRYDGLPGIEHASHLVVPLCPLDRRSRTSTIEGLEAAGYGMVERHRTEGYILLELQAP
ncbi:glycosyltransferase family 87 protein [Tropicimonas sediminicola]|uniref:DUF2029 domain-containing protein n=1 Tax=Tropicimonas sediminicola TaxID=1031541 RepID=A0A239KK12_9RHOB|nr:glycosyltransferase family 87 protein [Tropicimonas sediminicola]SNT18405.1 hypothetical protein SAMN05421757_107166 [Tropicimonas sediminicola]